MNTPDLREHQQKAVGDLSNGKILNGGVGSGKSRVAIAYYIAKELGRDIVVVTTARKKKDLDWDQEAIKWGIGRELSMPGRGTITVTSWNLIEQHVGDTDKFFIFDEQRVVGSGAWVKAFLKITSANRWILLSGTPGDTWMDYIPVFVANGFYRNKTDFITQHVVWSAYARYPKVDRYIATGKLVRLRNQILVDMPYERHTIRQLFYHDVSFDEVLYDKVGKTRWNPFTEEPIRDAAEYFRVIRRISNGDPSRVNAVRDIMMEHPRVIIFYNFDYELEELRRLHECVCEEPTRCSCGRVVVAEYNGKRHESIPSGEAWAYLVQYRAGAEGWNCITTDTMIFYSMTYSYKDFEQAQGRIDRLNTTFTYLNYYILRSGALIDRLVLKSVKNKQTFNERKNVRIYEQAAA